jgi:Protein of unknown function (DUF3551)
MTGLGVRDAAQRVPPWILASGANVGPYQGDDHPVFRRPHEAQRGSPAAAWPALFVDHVTFAVMTVPAAAQSPTSYPWCARSAKMDSGGTSCYFTSYRQCMTTLSGLGGYCFQSPYYHGPAAKVRAQAAR